MVRRSKTGRSPDDGRPERSAVSEKRHRHRLERKDDAERYWRLRMAMEFAKFAIWTVVEALRDGPLRF
jgi:hypothetical protein